MREPLVIKKMKRLAELAEYADLSAKNNEIGKYYSAYDGRTKTSSHPNTYQEILTDLDNRIAKIEAANGK